MICQGNLKEAVMPMEQFSVLVVDDEQEFVNTLIKRLRKKGLDCEGVHCGLSAIEAVKARDFDLVLLDVRLTGMDGNETLRQIKKIRPYTEVLLLSGHASAKAGREGLQDGAFDYLMKPMEFETLLEKLRTANKKKLENSGKRASLD